MQEEVKNDGREENEAEGMTDRQWKDENHGDHKENEEDDGKHNNTNVASQPTHKLSEYEKNKAKNVAELKARLTELDATHPMPKEFVCKPASKKWGGKKKPQGEGEPVQRQALTRNKGQQIESKR